MNKQDIDDMLVQASQKGTIHAVGHKPPEERSLFARLRKIGTPLLLGAALLTTIAGFSPKAPDLASSQQTTEMTAPSRQDFIKDQLQKEIMENGANVIVTSRFINHKESAKDYLEGQQWDGTGAGEHSKYGIAYQTVNPNHPTTIMATRYAGVSKELYEALCTPVKTYESTNRTTERCELPTGKDVTYSQDFFGGATQLKGDYSVNPDGSFNIDSLSLRVSDPSSPTEFTILSQATKDGVVQQGEGTVIDHSVEKDMGEIYNSVKISASSLKAKIESRNQGPAPARDLHMKTPHG